MPRLPKKTLNRKDFLFNDDEWSQFLKGKEIWRDVNGYKELFQISTKGRVKSFLKWQGRKGPRILTPFDNNRGYPTVTLKGKKFTVHKLVASNFLRKKTNKKDINHIDGNSLNPKLINLERCNRSENMLHAFKMGLCEKTRISAKRQGKINGIKTSKKVLLVEKNITYFSAKEAERKTGISQGNISACCNGRIKTAGGFTWRYV